MGMERKGQFFSLLEVALERLDKNEAKKLWYDVIENLGLKSKLESLNLNTETIPVGDIDLLLDWVQEFSIPILLSSDIWNRVIVAAGGSVTTYTGNENGVENKKSIQDIIKAIFIDAPKVLFRKIYKVFLILCSIEAVLFSVLILTDTKTVIHIIIKVIFHTIGLYTFFFIIFMSVGLFPFLILIGFSRFFMKPSFFSKFLSIIRILLIVLLLISPITFYLTDIMYSNSLLIKLYVFTATIGFILGGLSSIKNSNKLKSQ